MLQKSKHIISITLIALFLFPIFYQSAHVFGHAHDSDCCNSCNVNNFAVPVAEDTSLLVNPEEVSKDCPICEFHYPKLQLQTHLRFASITDIYPERFEAGYPKPFVVYSGSIKSLRAPPSLSLIPI